MRSSDKHLKAIYQEIPQPWITGIILKITYLNFHSYLSGANELTSADLFWKYKDILVVEIYHYNRQGPVYHTKSTPWLLMSWRYNVARSSGISSQVIELSQNIPVPTPQGLTCWISSKRNAHNQISMYKIIPWQCLATWLISQFRLKIPWADLGYLL